MTSTQPNSSATDAPTYDLSVTIETPGTAYEPHPHLGGREAALRTLAVWRSAAPGSPRIVLVTGADGSGRSRLMDGFLMLCDPEFRTRMALDTLDPATVPPDLPSPLVLDPTGLTVRETWVRLATAYERQPTDSDRLLAELAALDDPLPLFVPHVDRAGPVRYSDEAARVVREVLTPLAALPRMRMVVEVGRDSATALAAALPPGAAQLIDLGEQRWADPEGLVLQARALLDPELGDAPRLPFTTDADVRRAVADALVERVGAGDGSRLTVRLAVASLLDQPPAQAPTDPVQLPRDLAELLDQHAVRAGLDPQTLRQVLAPLALAEGEGLPAGLLSPLASAVARRDMRSTVEDCLQAVDPFLKPVARTTGDRREVMLVRLVHPGLARAVRDGFGGELPAVQGRIAVALLEAVPQQDWSKADPYVRDRIAAHALAAGLLPQLLTDPALFTFADPVVLRACVEDVPLETLAAPARTYRRAAHLLTEREAAASPRRRAELLEEAFRQDGLDQHAATVRGLLPTLG